MLESEVQQFVQLESGKLGNLLWRNNSGSFKDVTGRVVFFGLGNISSQYNKNIKSSDLIGITPIKITQSMVGKTIGVFTAIEVKKDDWSYKGNERETAQKKFLDIVKLKGGIASFAKSIDCYRQAIIDFISSSEQS